MTLACCSELFWHLETARAGKGLDLVRGVVGYSPAGLRAGGFRWQGSRGQAGGRKALGVDGPWPLHPQLSYPQ